MVNKKLREEIITQVGSEIQNARWYKQHRISSWHKNEDLLYENERFKKQYDTRAQVALNKMSGFIQTILSKIDDPLTFEFGSQNPADKKTVKKINSLKDQDAERDNWGFKDLLGKEQGVFYGRAIYHYYAENIDGAYIPHLTNIDVYDFLVDPNCGGLDIEQARHMGHFNAKYDRSELEAGIKSGKFLKEETKQILDASSSGSQNQEEINKDNRYMKYRTFMDELSQVNGDVFKFWSWITTYKGERYYILYSEVGGTAIRVEKLKDMIPSGKYPYWTWACFPTLTEFWSRSYADMARDIFMSQSVTINQMLDNADRINNPQEFVNTGMLVDENELIFKKRGYIRVNGPAGDVVASRSTPALDAPLAVYDTLEGIVQLQTGVTGASQGIAEEEKVGIYEGNIANTADRFNLLNKSYTNGYKRFACLYLEMLKLFLTEATAIKILGVDGVEVDEITGEDTDTYADLDIMVKSSNAENQMDTQDKKNKIMFLSKYSATGIVNPKVAFEIEAEIVGMSKDDIKRLLDTENSGYSDVVAEAHRDIEDILSGKEIPPNDIADIAYAKIFHEYLKDKREKLSYEKFMALSMYAESIIPVVARNQVQRVENIMAQKGILGTSGGVSGIMEQPIEAQAEQDGLVM